MASFDRLFVFGVVIAVCLSCVSSAFLKSLKHKSILNRKHNTAVSKRDDSEDIGPKLFFKGRLLKPVTRVTRRHNHLVLECEAGGSPGPTIHWLKNGERIEQRPYENVRDEEAVYEDMIGKDGRPLLRLSTTKSKLFIDCITPQIEGNYTCVADTPYQRISQTTKVKLISRSAGDINDCLIKRTIQGSKARINLWTATRVEFQDNSVQLFCRASGSPRPEITWYDAEEQPIQPGDKYQIVDTGDLIIKDIDWYDMGVYTCSAANKHGEDIADTFLYPTFREDDDEIYPTV